MKSHETVMKKQFMNKRIGICHYPHGWLKLKVELYADDSDRDAAENPKGIWQQ